MGEVGKIGQMGEIGQMGKIAFANAIAVSIGWSLLIFVVFTTVFPGSGLRPRAGIRDNLLLVAVAFPSWGC